MTRLSRIHQLDVIGMLWWYSFYATKWKSISSSTTSTPISQVLCQPEASHTPEKTFSRGCHVLNKFRTSLLCARSEKLILSSCRFCFKLFDNDCFNIPTFGQLFTTEEINQVQENQEREVAEIVATELAEIDLETDSVEEAEVDELFTGRV